VGKFDGKRPLGRPKLKWECSIKMDKWIFSKLVRGAWAGLIWPRRGGGIELSGCIKCRELFE
jgi:hypothetical protein